MLAIVLSLSYLLIRNQKKDEQFLPIKELEECFKHYPQILRNTQQLIDQCDVKIDFEHKKNKAHFISQLQDTEQLDKLTWKGFEKDMIAMTKKL